MSPTIKTVSSYCPMLTSAAIFPNVSRPNCLREIKWLCAESNRKRRQVRLAAKSLTLPSSKERFRKITAIWSTRCPSISLMPSFRGGWNKGSQIHSPDVPSTTENIYFYYYWYLFIIDISKLLKTFFDWLTMRLTSVRNEVTYFIIINDVFPKLEWEIIILNLDNLKQLFYSFKKLHILKKYNISTF